MEAAEQKHGEREQDVADVSGEVDAANQEDNTGNAGEQPRKPNHANLLASCSMHPPNALVQLQASQIKAPGEAGRNPQIACQLQRSLYGRHAKASRPRAPELQYL
ncbi:MAG TPA: hypothetical protein VK955_03695, partial [Xanthobacteraceae bacterium]|nr:hypothetical protein [Xanthobacteraceae bacterium]